METVKIAEKEREGRGAMQEKGGGVSSLAWYLLVLTFRSVV